MYLPDAHLRRYPELDGKTFLICVGAMKSATSWVHHYLQSLPGVVTSPLKELHFFNRKFSANALGDMDMLALKRLEFHLRQDGNPVENLENRDAFRASVDRAQMIYDDNAYFAHFAQLVDDDTRCFCDITPAYSVLGPSGLAYLKSFCAVQDVRVKLLFILRDPIDRLWSQMRHMQKSSKDKDVLGDWQNLFQSPRFCARADYHGTVTDLDMTFEADDLLYLFYEDLFARKAMRQLAQFAGAEPGSVNLANERHNETDLKADMPAKVRAAAATLLAPQYAFCIDRFGAAVPAAWQG